MKPITDYAFFKKLTALPFVEAIYLYGSRARGDNDDWSDVDLAIYCPKADTGDWLDIEEICDNADILVRVERTRYEKIQDAVFKAQVERDKKVLYEQHG